MGASAIRLCFLSRGAQKVVAFDRTPIRLGRGAVCEVRTDAAPEVRVEEHHGSIRFEAGSYVLVAVGPRCALWVNGRRTERCVLKEGARICLGAPDGPEVRVISFVVDAPSVVEEDEATSLVDPRVMADFHGTASKPPVFRSHPPAAPLRQSVPSAKVSLTVPTGTLGSGAARSQAPSGPGVPIAVQIPVPARAPLVPRAPVGVRAILARLKQLGKSHKDVEHWFVRAQRDMERARQGAAGASSGHTMVIMARALMGVQQTADGRTRGLRRTLGGMLLASAAVVFLLGGIIWFQHQRISALVQQKVAIDKEIQGVFDAMASETDEARLSLLEARLEVLMGKASEKLVQVKHAHAEKAQELVEPPDPLEVDIRKILKSFHAETYAIPPIFKQALEAQLQELTQSPTLHGAFVRKARYWPQIEGALRQKQLPEELGYIAFTESRFDPNAVNAHSHASGLWQLMEAVGRPCGLTIQGRVDERFDPRRSSDAAACYLSKLLVEFGEESFMLVLASYNRGENGVRHALHKLAKEPGGYRQRDFWHLYRLKLLPQETRDYVPRVIAAAIVLGNPGKYDRPRSQ